MSDRRIPDSSLADRSFWGNLAKNTQNDLSARLEPGILRSDTRALTSALASHERNLLHVIIRVITRNVITRNYAGCHRARNFYLVTIQIYLLAQRSERLYLIRESRVRASQTGHFGHFSPDFPKRTCLRGSNPGLCDQICPK